MAYVHVLVVCQSMGEGKINRVPFVIGLTGLIGLIELIIFEQSTAVISGFALGNLLAVLSYILLTKIVVKILAKNYTRRAGLVFLLFLKLFVLVGVLLLALVVLKVNVVAFLAGYGVLVVVVGLHGIF